MSGMAVEANAMAIMGIGAGGGGGAPYIMGLGSDVPTWT